jgi:hypothetical protein
MTVAYHIKRLFESNSLVKKDLLAWQKQYWKCTQTNIHKIEYLTWLYTCRKKKQWSYKQTFVFLLTISISVQFNQNNTRTVLYMYWRWYYNNIYLVIFQSVFNMHMDMHFISFCCPMCKYVHVNALMPAAYNCRRHILLRFSLYYNKGTKLERDLVLHFYDSQ